MPLFRRFSIGSNHRQTSISLPVGQVISLRYFQAAMGVMVLIGAFWGTLLLWQLSGVKEFIHMNLFEVNAHGQGQIYGWLGLAFMGACYRSLAPRASLPTAYAPLALILLGISLNMAGLYLIRSSALTLLGGLSLVAAALLFALQIYPRTLEVEGAAQAYLGLSGLSQASYSTICGKELATHYRSGESSSFQEGVLQRGSPPFLRAGLVFFLISTLYSLWHHQKIVSASLEVELFQQVASFQAPLRDLQVHGMALFLAAGLLSPTKSWKGFFLLLLGVLGESVLFLAYRTSEQSLFAALLILPWASLLAGVFFTRLPFKWSYRWLILSLVMLLALPLYSFLSHQAFSHAYYGAIRHAVTVGCFSQLALLLMPLRSEAQKPIFAWAILLLNIGCLSRVLLQILTDFHPIGFSLIPLSGATELIALIAAFGAIAFPSLSKPVRPYSDSR